MKKDYTLVFLATIFSFPFYWLAIYKAFCFVANPTDLATSVLCTTALVSLPFFAITAWGNSLSEEHLKDK
jgi:hypothetical protein